MQFPRLLLNSSRNRSILIQRVVFWWTSSIDMTLDTISVLVTQYNKNAATNTTTIHQDLSSLNIDTMLREQSLALEILEGWTLITNLVISRSMTAPTPSSTVRLASFISRLSRGSKVSIV